MRTKDRLLGVNRVDTTQLTKSSKKQPSILHRPRSPHGTASSMLYASGRSNGSRLQKPGPI